jgi:hypothetical protein
MFLETILCPGSAPGNQPSATKMHSLADVCATIAFWKLKVKTPCCFRFLPFPTQIPDKIFSKR